MSRRHGRRGRGLAHRRHVVPGVGIRRRRRALGHGAGRADRRPGRSDAGRIRRRRAAPDATGGQLDGGLDGVSRRAVPGVALREHRGGRGREEQRDETHGPTDHDEAPVIGRTVTTLNMPACMCISM
ncbi:hypothetical protein LTR94_031687 [Friedmanniomyces endolithicus]|nr:hypothetical protein LTR94_031687 [Friedmanniomyces endolithicus]